MIFDDNFYNLTGGRNIKGSEDKKDDLKNIKDKEILDDIIDVDFDRNKETKSDESKDIFEGLEELGDLLGTGISGGGSLFGSSSKPGGGLFGGGSDTDAGTDFREEKDAPDANENKDTDSIGTYEVPEIGPVNPGAKWSSEYGNPDFDYVIESDLVSPKVETVKTEKKLIVVVDDDFETLDLLEIFLKRNYEYASFSGPREAIFYLNQHMPDLVLIDCKIHTMKAKTFVDIVRTGPGKDKIPFVFLGDQEEINSLLYEELPKGVIGWLKRPVSRGELQGILDITVEKKE